mgnify:CR=1 FL=1
MNILSNDNELRAATRSYNVNDDGNVRTFFDDNYMDFGGFQRFKKKQEVRAQKRVVRKDNRQATRQQKGIITGIGERMRGKAASLRSDQQLAQAVAASASQPTPKRAAPKGSNKNLYIGLGIAAALVGAFFLLKKKK